ncbi:helix-turn-helix domain-containing protein [Paenibacillus sp. ATY16]|uniref:helix-turn-helix domain-containing protein n=1 Tax=Paenibacillus sp. ATY16 TaxID=1759312 RepID=UPI000E2F55C4|nr:helix-turn-helix domain-containing protein [Paenibacillus sp. ATY16]MCK9857072.1 AraC family transcriptional regulator [Paenibacillus sp. ATY16]
MLTLQQVRQDRGTDWFDNGTRPEGASTLVLSSYGKVVYWVGNEKIILEKGDLLYIPACQSYYGKCVPTVFHEKYVIEFTADTPPLPLLQNNHWVKSRTGAYELILERIKTMHNEWTEKHLYADVLGLAILYECLALWNRELDEGPATSAAHQQVERMKSYIMNYYQQKITKEELGEYIRKSPNYAATLFRRVTGQTISEYVHKARVKKAIYLLVDSTLTVGEISESVGYRDLSYFQRIFKRETGKTPTAYMKDRPKPPS